jgi:3-oxoacyl-[acyl-carrier-protein] synthase II
VTGIGVLSPVGIGRERYWEALAMGKSGFSPISLFDTSSFTVHMGGQVQDFDPAVFLGKKGLRDLDRSTRLFCSAAALAIDDAHLRITDENSSSMGISTGTTFGSLHSIFQFDRDGLIEGPRFVNPSHFPNTVINSPSSRASIRFNIKGFNTTISTGFCSGLDAVSYAADFIKLKRADVVLAGGVEELCQEIFLGFYNLGHLSGTSGTDPISCPFDARRNGIILSEGAAILILEDFQHALGRGAEVLAVVRGYANAFDSAAIKDFSHEGKGLRQAVTRALADSSLHADDIDCVSACANSTKGLDRFETRVMKKVFGDRAAAVPITAIKSMIGESFSASGALSLSAAVGMLERGFIPPTKNYEKRDPDCDLDYVSQNRSEKNIRNVLVLSSDPYGSNAAMVLGSYEG